MKFLEFQSPRRTEISSDKNKIVITPRYSNLALINIFVGLLILYIGIISSVTIVMITLSFVGLLYLFFVTPSFIFRKRYEFVRGSKYYTIIINYPLTSKKTTIKKSCSDFSCLQLYTQLSIGGWGISLNFKRGLKSIHLLTMRRRFLNIPPNEVYPALLFFCEFFNLKFKIHWSAKTSTYNVSELIKSKWNLNKE